jgi:hypothetical protein
MLIISTKNNDHNASNKSLQKSLKSCNLIGPFLASLNQWYVEIKGAAR